MRMLSNTVAPVEEQNPTMASSQSQRPILALHASVPNRKPHELEEHPPAVVGHVECRMVWLCCQLVGGVVLAASRKAGRVQLIRAVHEPYDNIAAAFVEHVARSDLGERVLPCSWGYLLRCNLDKSQKAYAENNR